MTDIINLNSIRSDNCDCNKPKKPTCGCSSPKPQSCHLSIDLSDLYFKVKNLFGELKSEWQRAEARSNLGVTDIIDLRLTEFGVGSGATNKWEMTVSKSGVEKRYELIVKNGDSGESATIEIVGTRYSEDENPRCVLRNPENPSHPLYILEVPRPEKGETGIQGPTGPDGKSAYDLYRENTTDNPIKSLTAWLESLKGQPGDPGENFKIKSVSLISHPAATLPDDAYVWKITLNNGEAFNFWVPQSLGIQPSPSGIPVIMYYKKHYNERPSENILATYLNDLLNDVNNNNGGKSVDQLEALGWKSFAPSIGENDFLFSATSIKINEVLGRWQVVRLTALPGADGTSTEGTKGDFKSTAFTRTNADISNITPTGGDYNNPLPVSDSNITWYDGIPDIVDGEIKILWSTTRIFKGNGELTSWSKPTKVLDTPTYDVEFSPYSNSEDTAPRTTDNIETSNDWFDPIKDANALPLGKTWSDMIWRAERHRDGQSRPWGPWVITRIKGEKGESIGGQGLTGPVIRMRGTWVAEAGRGRSGDPECYKNESDELPELDTIRFIDVVFHNGSYWMVRSGITCATPGVQPESNLDQWIKATQFDFAYINTLISDYISTNYIDAEEIRIHDRAYDSNDVLTQDIIVAGMTSGKSKNNSEENQAGSVRIWAGSNVNVINGNVDKYTLDLTDAKFKVHSDGSLFASKANIEGTIQANTLRLGQLNTSNEGTFICPENTNGITLPKLASNKIQMFYILTNYSNITSNITVTAQGTDKILYTNGTTTIKDSTFPAKPNKLYQLFGVSDGTSEVWYVVELDLAAATVIINPEEDADFCGIESIIIITNDEWTKPNDLVEEYILQTLNIKGSVYVLFKNETNTQKTINADDIKIKIKYDAQAIEIDPAMLMIPSQLANQVSYMLTLHLLSSLVSSNGSKLLTYDYIGNNTYDDSSTAAIGNISYNGTSDANNATYNGKPDIGVVTVVPSTINEILKTTEDGDTKITLTNIPVTVL